MSTAAQTPTGIEALNPAQLELDCQHYLWWRKEQEIAKTKADAVKARIMHAVEKFGQVPTNAEKSRRLETAKHVVTVTTGTAFEINDQAACELELLLSRARCGGKFALLFTRRSEYSLVKSAADAIKHERWPKKFAADIRMLFLSCFSTSSKTPSLTVEPREAVEKRERVAAAKAAKKSSRKGGK